MFEIGNGLREARIRKGLDLKEAEDATKIRCKYLQALEDDDFEVIPGPAFVKGFMRTYAAFLGLDADLLLDEYRSRYEPTQEAHPVARRPMSDSRHRGPRRQSNLVLVGVVALVLLLLIAWWARGDDDTSATLDPVAVEPSSTTTLATVPQTVVSEEEDGASEGDGTTAEDETTTTLPEGQLVLEVTAARGRCWLLVKEETADGRILYSGTLETGDTVRLDEAGAYWVNVGSPSSIDVSLNGAPADVPEPYGNFLLTAAGSERIR